MYTSFYSMCVCIRVIIKKLFIIKNKMQLSITNNFKNLKATKSWEKKGFGKQKIKIFLEG